MAAQVKALVPPLRGPSSGFAGLAGWIGDTIAHAFGNPREEQAHQPPMIGVQPFRDDPRRR